MPNINGGSYDNNEQNRPSLAFLVDFKTELENLKSKKSKLKKKSKKHMTKNKEIIPI